MTRGPNALHSQNWLHVALVVRPGDGLTSALVELCPGWDDLLGELSLQCLLLLVEVAADAALETCELLVHSRLLRAAGGVGSIAALAQLPGATDPATAILRRERLRE